ncbi:MAG: HEPN domain-containing protein [Candidatus Aenigmarchaeota archaeon]|nr:HEPN domain-containing protein [Candidatus Aenigmarchaeota archaeon]
MDVKKCLEKGFLKRVKPDKMEIKKELSESKNDMEDAKNSLKNGKYKWAIIQAYYSMFHSARTVLVSNGYRERKHFAITIVLEHLVRSKKLESYFVDDFKAAIFAREEADYSSVYSKERAEQILTAAEEFADRMEKLVSF